VRLGLIDEKPKHVIQGEMPNSEYGATLCGNVILRERNEKRRRPCKTCAKLVRS
jgi:hypothetical protein